MKFHPGVDCMASLKGFWNFGIVFRVLLESTPSLLFFVIQRGESNFETRWIFKQKVTCSHLHFKNQPGLYKRGTEGCKERQWYHQRILMSWIERGKIIVLHARDALWCNFLILCVTQGREISKWKILTTTRTTVVNYALCASSYVIRANRRKGHCANLWQRGKIAGTSPDTKFDIQVTFSLQEL